MTSKTEPALRRAPLTDAELRPMANAVRALAMDAVEAAKSGHPGMPMGMADVAAVLFGEVLSFDPGDPDWPDRDRFVLSAGHGSMLLYALLHLTGYKAVSMDELRAFRQWMSLTPGHPEYRHTPGVETTTGPLGQGLANAVGMAMAELRLRGEFGPDIVDHRTFVIAGDGDLMEGISHEAISLAGHLKLDRLTVLFDDNRITIDGGLELSESGDTQKRFEAAGWFVTQCDGHDYEAIRAALQAAEAAGAPALIACRTIIGKGAPNLQGTSKTHGAPLGAEEIAAARKTLGWDHPPFEIPDDIRDRWRAAGERGKAVRQSWLERCRTADDALIAEFTRRIDGGLPDGLAEAFLRIKKDAKAAGGAVATRKASGNVLDAIAPLVPEFIGGSGDLTGSNNTKAKDAQGFSPENPTGTYVYYGIREHGMAAAMNGMALHGGLIPFGGTFLVFSDYCRPSIRLAALMGLRTVFVLTHDSIGLGEDGPTHQPIEHLAALRAIPHLTVFRPADAVETAECWELALQAEGPSAIALTRQGLPLLRTEDDDANRSAKGAYVLKEAGAPAQVTLLATGSEVSLADEARTALEAEGIGTRLVSMPAWELFEEQDPAYREAVLGPGTVRIAVEAASPFGWERYTGARENVIGLDHFGASAPYQTLYENFGLTRDAIAAKAREALAGAEKSALTRTTRT